MLFTQPIFLDIAFCIFILIFSLFGFKNGFIKEFQKCLTIFISILTSSFVMSFFIGDDLFLNRIYFLCLFILLIFIIGFIIDLILYNIDVIKIDDKSNQLIGFVLGTLKSFLLISILLFGIQIIPLHDSTKMKISEKAEKSSMFTFCKGIQNFILDDNMFKK